MAGSLETETSASIRVVRAVAEATEREPLDLPPLGDVVDPDAIDAMFADAGNPGGRERSECQVSFSYDGVDVLVRGDGDVTVESEAPGSRDERDLDA